MTSEEFKDKIIKLRQLKESGTLSYTEYSIRTDKLLNDLQRDSYPGTAEDFLIDIAYLVDNGTINFETLERIKEIVFSKEPEVPVSQPQAAPLVEPGYQKPNIIDEEESESGESVSGTSYVPDSKYYYSPYKKEKNITGKILGIIIFLLAAAIITLLANKYYDPVSENVNTQTIEDNKDKETVRKVISWIAALGKQDFYTAYNMLKGKKWGQYSYFSSTRSYGGITKTRIWDCYELKSTAITAEVFADYDSFDPNNNDARLKQKFLLKREGSEWFITDIKNIEIDYYKKRK